MLSSRPCRNFPKYRGLLAPKCGCLPCREKFAVSLLRKTDTQAELDAAWENVRLRFRQLARKHGALTEFLLQQGAVIHRRETREARPVSGR